MTVNTKFYYYSTVYMKSINRKEIRKEKRSCCTEYYWGRHERCFSDNRHTPSLVFPYIVPCRYLGCLAKILV